MTAANPPQEFKLIDIREVWPGEARDFTPWLADNLEALSEHLEIGEMELDSTEVEVPGGRRLDILAKDADGRNWAVENQYGEADHDHLTRALAYAVGLECRAVIVVAESHRDEFVAVADEWNRYSEAYGSNGIRLFLVAIEAGRIGDSRPGFRFRLVAGPNEWKSETATGQRPLSEADRLRREQRRTFWIELRTIMENKGNLGWGADPNVSVNVRTRGPFSFYFTTAQRSSRIGLYIDSGDKDDNDSLFQALEEEREAIHESLEDTLEWTNNPRYRANKVTWKPDEACGYRSPVNERQTGHQVLADAMYRFHNTLMPYVERLI
ncbi:MAG: DUF4268 domain-containing protein [Acidimicrobiia bacterium]|nr:DUF4268 domain-containing protein [Acidimicrobiia bacterium]